MTGIDKFFVAWKDLGVLETFPLPEYVDMRHIFARMSKPEVVDFVRVMHARRKLIAEAERYGEA